MKRTEFGQPLKWAILENAAVLLISVISLGLIALGLWKLVELILRWLI